MSINSGHLEASAPVGLSVSLCGPRHPEERQPLGAGGKGVGTLRDVTVKRKGSFLHWKPHRNQNWKEQHCQHSLRPPACARHSAPCLPCGASFHLCRWVLLHCYHPQCLRKEAGGGAEGSCLKSKASQWQRLEQIKQICLLEEERLVLHGDTELMLNTHSQAATAVQLWS